jgi:hypothetical protein
MSSNWDAVMHQYYGNLPHPDEPRLSVNDFPVAVKLATKLKGQGMAEAKEAAQFWEEFQTLGISPNHFEELVDQMAPLAWKYQQRPPTLREVQMHAEKGSPREMRDYYGNLPSVHDPAVTAHEFTQAHAVAQRYSTLHLGRDPFAGEVTFFHHAKAQPQHMEAHYQGLADARAAQAVKP